MLRLQSSPSSPSLWHMPASRHVLQTGPSELAFQRTLSIPVNLWQDHLRCKRLADLIWILYRRHQYQHRLRARRSGFLSFLGDLVLRSEFRRSGYDFMLEQSYLHRNVYVGISGLALVFALLNDTASVIAGDTESWSLPAEITCAANHTGSTIGTLDTADWPAGEYALRMHRISWYGTNGVENNPNATPETSHGCIHPPFSSKSSRSLGIF